MAQIIFYEKPGCINNTKQKKLLRDAGHVVIEKNLLTEPWSENPALLTEFFDELPVNQWFNSSAPAIKQGSINPETLTAEQTITAMLSDPLLIRRPLMAVGTDKRVGFNESEIEQWIGLTRKSGEADLESCPMLHKMACSDE